MSMNNEERLDCLITHCNKVKEAYNAFMNSQGKPEGWYKPWDDFLDALEAIEEGMK